MTDLGEAAVEGSVATPVRWGYARLSPIDSGMAEQIGVLEQAGCTSFVCEIASLTDERPRLDMILASLKPGDTLYVSSLDRLVGTLAELSDLMESLGTLRVSLVSVEDEITSAESDFRSIVDALARHNRAVRRELQMEGIEKAKQRGVYKGRKASVDPVQVLNLLDAEVGPTEIAERLGISRTTVWRIQNGRSEG